MMTCGDNEHCSNSKVQRNVTKQEQSNNGPPPKKGIKNMKVKKYFDGY